ncbi:ABC transporter permease [Jannaschia sp.]|nr:ABC transporter permease [Jannaschia sp.]
MNAFYLAAANVRIHWMRTLVLIVAAALVLAVPVLTRALLAQREAALTARADAALLLGTRGSRLDLVTAGAYFTDDLPEPATMAASEAVWDSRLAVPVPLHTPFTAGGIRIVGTTFDYVDLRELDLSEGRPFALLGEAVLGSGAAACLGVGIGDTILSDPENLFDLDGAYSLEVGVVGLLAPTGTRDDDAVFVDIKMAWVIESTGHGHEDIVVEGEDAAAAAAARVVQFARITEANIDSFHFHGDPAGYPVTAVMVAPYDERSATILWGRYLDAEGPVQAVVPTDVIDALVARLLRIASLVDAVTIVVGIAAALALGLALFLSWRLRAPEMRTAFALGAGRGTIARLVLTELGLVPLGAVLLALPIVIVLQSQSPTIAARLIALGS